MLVLDFGYLRYLLNRYTIVQYEFCRSYRITYKLEVCINYKETLILHECTGIMKPAPNLEQEEY